MAELDVIQISKQIESKITLLEHGRSELRGKAKDRATAISEYDKCLAVAIINHRDSGKYPATLIEKIAKGDCYKERAAAELAEAEYKLTVTKMNAIQAELNGWQSIFRHLESV